MTRIQSTPIALSITCGIIALIALSPLAYIILKAVNSDFESWKWLLRWNTAIILWHSLLLSVTVTAVSASIALPIALLTCRTNIRLRKFWDVTTVLPLVIPSYVGAYLFISAIGPKGIIQNIAEPLLGWERLPDMYGFTGAVIVLTLLNYPYVLLTLRSTINQIDPSEEESARLLGLNPLTTLLRITIPQIRPALVSGSLLVVLYTLSDFGAVSILRYKTFTWSIYNQYEASFDRNTAALLSVLLCMVATSFVYLESITRGRVKYFRVSTGSARSQPTVELGLWQLPCIFFCGSIVLVSVAIPMSVLTYWLLRGISSGEQLSILFGASLNSLTLAILTSVTVIGSVIPVAYLSVRHRNYFSGLVEKACFTGFALPSVAVSISLVFFAAQIGKPIYQSIWLLVLACFILYLPTGLGAVRSTMLHISPRIDESSRTLGRGALRTSISVTLPLLKPGIVMGGAIVFLVTMKELPAVLMLSPLDFSTLTSEIWSYSSEAFFAKAALPSLILILLSSVPLTLILAKSGFKR